MRRLSGLVSNILLLSRIENQAILSRKEKFRLDEQIRQAILALETKWTEKEINLEAELETVAYTGNFRAGSWMRDRGAGSETDF